MTILEAPTFIAANTLQVQLGTDVVWLDVRDDPVKLHYVAEGTFGLPTTGPRWVIVGYDLSSQDGAGTLGVVDWHTGEKRPISPDGRPLHGLGPGLVGATDQHRLSRARAQRLVAGPALGRHHRRRRPAGVARGTFSVRPGHLWACQRHVGGRDQRQVTDAGQAIVTLMPNAMPTITASTDANTPVAPLIPQNHGVGSASMRSTSLMPPGNAKPMTKPTGITAARQIKTRRQRLRGRRREEAGSAACASSR